MTDSPHLTDSESAEDCRLSYLDAIAELRRRFLAKSEMPRETRVETTPAGATVDTKENPSTREIIITLRGHIAMSQYTSLHGTPAS